jgi:DNA-binding transcriptional ArsR family regulator
MQTRSTHLDDTFAALADPTRRAILARLASGQATVSELAAPFDLSAPAISRHLKVLRRAGLIEQGRRAQWRPCRLRPEGLRDVADWVGQYRVLWEDSLDRLDDYLRELQATGDGDDLGPEPTDGRSRNDGGATAGE